MGNTPVRFPSLRIACAAGTLLLAGCVPNAYLYDDAPQAYSGGSYGYYPPSTGYYAHPGYYGPVYAPPRVVYVDHDHRGDDCRHESHRDRRPHDDRGGHDRNGHDHEGQDRDGRDRDQGPHDDRKDREPRGVRGMSPPADRAPPDAAPCAGRKCGSPGAPPELKAPREPGRPADRGPDSVPESQRALD